MTKGIGTAIGTIIAYDEEEDVGRIDIGGVEMLFDSEAFKDYEDFPLAEGVAVKCDYMKQAQWVVRMYPTL